MPAVTSILDGGLGNQMFQFAAARALSLRQGAALRLDLRRLRARDHRPYGLGDFHAGGRFETIESGELPAAPRRAVRLVHALLGKKDYHLETAFPFDRSVMTLRPPVVLDGYFQSELYFADQAAVIRADFAPSAEKQAVVSELARRLLPEGPSVSLHVRRGDYATAENQAVHGLLDPTYYAAALALLAGKVTATVCVFTDDPAWVRANLALPASARYVSEHTASPAEDLMLMARCSHHITANSSFSWWGAWLNPDPAKIVITPSQWFQPGSGLDTRDLRPAGWLSV
jgi:hypothetical protein